jgi:hypothetical protein
VLERGHEGEPDALAQDGALGGWRPPAGPVTRAPARGTPRPAGCTARRSPSPPDRAPSDAPGVRGRRAHPGTRG